MPPIDRFDDAAPGTAARDCTGCDSAPADTPIPGGAVADAAEADGSTPRPGAAYAGRRGRRDGARPGPDPATPAVTGPGLDLERLDALLRDRADRARSRARLGLVVVLVGLLAAGTAVVVPGSVDGGLGMQLAFAAPGLIGMAIGAVVLAAAWTRFGREDHLRQRGVLTQGRVRSADRGPFGMGLAIAFEYRDAARRLHQTASDTLSVEETERWSAGDVGLILYDSTNPSDAVWLGIRAPGA